MLIKSTLLEKCLHKWKLIWILQNVSILLIYCTGIAVLPFKLIIQITKQSKVKYSDMHQNRHLTLTGYIELKVVQMKLKSSQLHLLIGPRSKP